MRKHSDKKLYVANKAQAVLFTKHMIGQISDGAWENSGPRDHWKDWGYDIEVIVDPENIGRNFWARKCNYNFTRPDLMEWCGDEFIETVKKELNIDEYSMKNLRKDLNGLKKAVRIFLT